MKRYRNDIHLAWYISDENDWHIFQCISKNIRTLFLVDSHDYLLLLGVAQLVVGKSQGSPVPGEGPCMITANRQVANHNKPQPNFNGCEFKVWQWKNYFTPHTLDVIIYSCWKKLIHTIKSGLERFMLDWCIWHYGQSILHRVFKDAEDEIKNTNVIKRKCSVVTSILSPLSTYNDIVNRNTFYKWLQID